MASRGQLLRPGVEVLQTFRTPSPTFVRPILAPCVVGPAFEVINVLNSDATLNPKAKWGAYTQVGRTILQSEFPDARGNNDELDIQESSIRAFLVSGGSVSELPLNPGSAFLASVNTASKATLRTAVFGGNTGLDVVGKVLVLSLDNPVRTDTTRDITIVFKGTAGTPLKAAEVAAQINDAVGQAVATVVGTAPNDRVQIASPTFGALSSVTVRKGGSANTLLHLAVKTSDSSAVEERVEGAGFRGQDDNDNDTQTPWIEFYSGDYLQDGTPVTFDADAGLIGLGTGTLTSAKAAAVTFGVGGLPVRAGDYFFADGVRLKSGEVTKVEATRFKVGTINTARSVADASGKYISKVYDTQEVATLFDGSPFAPKYAYFQAQGLTGNTAPTAATLVGTVAGDGADVGTVTGVNIGYEDVGPFDLAGLRLDYVVTVDGVETESSFTFTGSYMNMGAVADAIAIPGVVASTTGSPEQLVLSTAKTGAGQKIILRSTGTANDALGFGTGFDMESTGSDTSIDSLTGTSLSFTLDKSPRVYTVPLTSDSLVEAMEAINTIVGAPVASLDGDRVRLTSPLKGLASQVSISNSTGATALGLTGTANGTGRPLPDARLDETGALVLQSQILRDVVTGHPLDPATNTASLYLQFKALRKDVTAVAKEAGVLRLSDVDTLTQVLNPISEDNPLGLGLFLAMLAAPGMEVKGLGVDEVTAAAPEGTLVAHARAAGLLETEEVYAIAPLTQDEAITSLWRTHAVAMSEPEQGGERIVFFNHKSPLRKNASIALSGTQANSTSTANQLLLDASPSAGLLALGINPALPILASTGVYAEFETNASVLRYSVSSVTGALVSFRTAFAPGENTDGFYSTATFNDALVNAAYAIKVRGAPLAIPGSSLLDYNLVADTVAEANEALRNRRAFSVFPESVKATVGGIEKVLPGYYGCAVTAGMVAGQPPQQGFTNLPMPGLTGVAGTEKFSKRQLNIMAGGGTYILIQDVQGGPVVCRHQLSTDLTSIETQELSITKVVDFVAKLLRQGIRKFIGTNVVNGQLLDAVGTALNGMLTFLVDTGVINGFELNNIAQDSAQPDTVLIDVTLDVPYPCNYIRLTLVA